jgi:hypothetical protein
MSPANTARLAQLDELEFGITTEWLQLSAQDLVRRMCEVQL